MASQPNGGQVCPGNFQVLGDADINGDLNVDGNLTVSGSITAGSISAGASLKLTPTASPPAVAAEGMLYADTDHKLYYHNGTDWKEVTFAA